MSQLSKFLRRTETGYVHWCPGCHDVHAIPDQWSFDGNFDAPTFSPSVKVTGKQRVVVGGQWTGEWQRDAQGNAIEFCCHYFLTAGRLTFCADSTHALAGKTVPVPPLPGEANDAC